MAERPPLYEITAHGEPLKTVAELAKHLHVNPSFIYRAVEQDPPTIPFIRIGKLLRFDLEAVMATFSQNGNGS